jgi:hypothetical protein
MGALDRSARGSPRVFSRPEEKSAVPLMIGAVRFFA